MSPTTEQTITSNWHRAMLSHWDGRSGHGPVHSHCPYCGNEVGSAATACARCDHRFPASEAS